MARFIMAGRLQAFGFIALFSVLAIFMPPLSLFSSAAIALITLRQGWQQGLLLMLAGSALLGLLTFTLEKDMSNGFLLGLIQWIPIVLIANILHKSISWRPTLQTVFALTGVGILLFHAIVPNGAEYWSEILNKSGAPALLKQSNPELDIKQWINTVAQSMTGMMALVLSLSWCLSLLLARHWQAQLYNPGGFGKEFRNIHLGKTSAMMVIALIAVAITTQQQLAIELVICGVAVFMFQGLSLAHAAAKHFELHTMILILLYVLLFIMLKPIALLLAAFGIIDCFANFRDKLIRK
jgi:hypothetical protein